MERYYNPASSFKPSNKEHTEPTVTQRGPSNFYQRLEFRPKNTKYLLPYAGVDLRRLPWDKVIEIMEKQAEVYKLYQINVAYGYDWENQQIMEYIENFNAQFRLSVERMSDPKQLPCFITKCIPIREYNWKKRPVPGLVPKKFEEVAALPRKRKMGHLGLPKDSIPAKVQQMDPPIYRYTPTATTSSMSITTGQASAPAAMPIVAKFRIQRLRDDNNCEFFDLTADPDFEDKVVKPKPSSD